MAAWVMIAALSGSAVSCGGGAEAASMKLRKTEGDVEVEDNKGKSIVPEEEMNLYSGYLVGTEKKSYAWIDLDRVKLTKVDSRSEVEIKKKKDKLEIIVNSGNLFFNITEPLDDDETLDIRSSSLGVGIRGTCGWVEVEDDSEMRVYILEGKVKCSIPGDGSREGVTTSVLAGEMAEMTVSKGEADIAVEEITVDQIPDFVMEELEEDEELYERILEDSGLDVWGEPEEEAVIRTVPENVVYYGDRSQCRMAPEQAEAFAGVIRQEMEELQNSYEDLIQRAPNVTGEIRFLKHYAALVDMGGGNPALLCGGGAVYNWEGNEVRDDGAEFAYCSRWGLWQYIDGAAVKFSGAPRGWGTMKLYPGHLLEGGYRVSEPGYLANAYALGNGSISGTPTTIGYLEEGWVNNVVNRHFQVDGQDVGEAEFNSWRGQWDRNDSLAGYDYGSDISSRVWGLGPAEGVLAMLDTWSDGGEDGSRDSQEDVWQEETSSAPESDSQEGISSYAFPVTETYDPATRIRRVTLDPQGYPVEVYHEIPVFEESTPGYRRINRHFQELEKAFFSSDGDIPAVWEQATDPGIPDRGITYNMTVGALITAETPEMVSVQMPYFWFMGGTTSYGESNYVFDPETGEQLKITDLIEGTKEEIHEMVQEALRAQLGDDMGMIWSDGLRNYDTDQFDFYVLDGHVHVGFDKYEIAAGAAGDFDVKLEAPLKRN